ncbi:hypothetical protein GSbR_31420 [Geobacter sp. SVR]|nr:hypothetical protein GSVR_03950 [Geobacter sp. SVR]GCF86542.1 hypothetical protein GSbR_31420 [Geobacter sp. SVR]
MSAGKYVWIPEVASLPGIFAIEKPEPFGDFTNYVTRNVQHALQFRLKSECQKWCKKNLNLIPDKIWQPTRVASNLDCQF